jgi:Transposase DDE domain
VPGQNLVAAYCAEAQAVLAQIKVDAKTNEHKAALQLLGILPVKGNIFTGDARFCQRDHRAEIIAAGGDYVPSDVAAPSLAAAMRTMGNCLSQALGLLGLPQLE